MKTLALLLSLFCIPPNVQAAPTPSATATTTPERPQLIFIVNQASKVKELSINDLSDLYLKKNRYWPDGSKVRFFDQSNSSPVKALFLKQVLKKTSRDLDLFWIGEKNGSGQGAPLEVPSDDMVISSVASVPGAIGYISASSVDEDLDGVHKVAVKGLE